jgi:signal peptidase
MEIEMEPPRITEPPSTVGRPPSAIWSSLAVRILFPPLLAAATVVVIGLLAITVGPRFLPYQALVVRSGSMAPKIPTGSVVFYSKLAADKVKVGQIIVFSRPGQPGERVTHRVFKIGKSPTGPYFITKGDANGAPDDWRVPAVGTGWVAGLHVPYVGYVLADLQSTTARLLLLLIPALALGAITLFEIWRDRGRGETA